MTLREVISIVYGSSKTAIGELMVDAFISESHSFSAEISEHPVESGQSIVDHVRNLPITLTIDGIISNTPMSMIGLTAFDSANRFLNKESNDFSARAFEKIEKLFQDRKPLTICTSIKDYRNMVLESLSVERGAGSNESLHFKCTAKQICIVEQSLIKIPQSTTTRTQPKQRKGLQEAKPVPPKEIESLKKENSFLMSIFKG